MKKVIPILKIKKFKTIKEVIEFCNHILSHKERYEDERVFEARELLNNYNNF